MGIVRRRNFNQQDGRNIKDSTQPLALRDGTTQEKKDRRFPPYPLTGYHRFSPRSYIDGKNGSPYSRAISKNGILSSCGLDAFEENAQRQELLLTTTGEPVILLRRKWTGEICPCRDSRRGHTKFRCKICFSTGFVGGYVRYVNPREPQGRIRIRVSPVTEDLELKPTGAHQVEIPSCWTLTVPVLRDRDLLLRFDPETREETWRYEVLDVERNIGFLNRAYAQKFRMQRQNKTDPVYNIRELDLLDMDVGDLRNLTGTDALANDIAGTSGDGFNDRGFSQGYLDGFHAGFNDALNNRDFVGIPDLNVDALVDLPYGPNRFVGPYDPYDSYNQGSIVQTAYGYGVSIDKDEYLQGFREGYKDGFQDGTRERNRRELLADPDRSNTAQPSPENGWQW